MQELGQKSEQWGDGISKNGRQIRCIAWIIEPFELSHRFKMWAKRERQAKLKDAVTDQ
jgi:hypothetical protein